ncbi:MAG TPA: hypothetical protein VGO99_06185 [Leifsonia sp.]|nr:hypothetical protein [Leifsonia sp.]
MRETVDMRVLLKFVLDCDPDAAWRALQSPTAFREVAMPWVDVRPERPGELPTVWGTDEYRVRVRALGAIAVGTQAIRLNAVGSREPGVRILRDSGGGESGLLAAIPHLDHQMAIAPDPAGPDSEGRIRTLYRDKLEVHAGVLTPIAWYTLWAFWQWRGRQLRRLAPTWAYDPPPPEAAAGGADTDAAADGSGTDTPAGSADTDTAAELADPADPATDSGKATDVEHPETAEDPR